MTTTTDWAERAASARTAEMRQRYLRRDRRDRLTNDIKSCRRCPLNRTRAHAAPLYGPYEGAEIVLVGEAPGAEEDSEGRPFVGRAGKLLKRAITAVGGDPEKVIYMNVLGCVVGSALVSSPSPIEIGYRRWYVGPVVTIESLGGVRLTVTPNHPVLTDRGWVKASNLSQSDRLICHDGEQFWTIASNPDVKHPPTLFEKLYRSLSIFGACQRRVGSVMDFHGDGMNGNIDVASVDGQLQSGFCPSIGEPHGDLGFIESNNAKSGLLRFGTLLQPQGFLFAGNPSSGGASGGCSQSLAFLESGVTHPDEHGLTGGSSRSVGMFQGSQSRAFPQTKLTGSLPSGEPSEIESSDFFHDLTGKASAGVDPVVKITPSFFRGHVYNLQTEAGFYVADGIVVQNCRPPKNRDPLIAEITACEPLFRRQLEAAGTLVGVTVGAFALRTISPEAPAISNALNKPFWKEGRVWIPTYHPAYVLRNPLKRGVIEEGLEVAFEIARGEQAVPKIAKGDLGNKAVEAALGKQGWTMMHLRILDEQVVVVSHSGVVVPPAVANLPRYTIEEMLRLGIIGAASMGTKRQIRAIHTAKVKLNGTVVA